MTMTAIRAIKARQIFDSRGNPTVEAEVFLESGLSGIASVPSGASTGQHEAVEKRDKTKAFGGKGVFQAIDSIKGEIFDVVSGIEAQDQSLVDQQMIQLDGTANKSRLGANAILAVSLATAKAAAAELKLPLYRYLGGINACVLPIPFINIINGGAHADNKLDFQEFMIVPVGANSFHQALQMANETFHHLKELLRQKSFSTMVGDEGGFAPLISDPKQILNLITQAIEKSGYKAGTEMGLALDIAASEFFKDNKYHLTGFKKVLDANGLVQLYKDLSQEFPIISIEDGMAEDDWNGWDLLTKTLGNRMQLVGDDLFVTNTARLIRGIEKDIANAILVKPNQIGTLTETLSVIRLAQKSSYKTIISHRSGETEDTTIADLAVAVNAGQIKTGSMSRTDRLAKYNQLLRIEEQLGKAAVFAGKKSLFFPLPTGYSDT